MDPYEARRIVGQYFRVRADHPGYGVQGLNLPPGELSRVFTQLAADADHSDLLVRLFKGEEPLPYGEWLEQRT